MLVWVFGGLMSYAYMGIGVMSDPRISILHRDTHTHMQYTHTVSLLAQCTSQQLIYCISYQ